MLPLCKLVTKTLQFSVSWNQHFLLSLSIVQSGVIVLSFSKSSILHSVFLPTAVLQMMLGICQWLHCVFCTVSSLLFELCEFSVWKHSSVLSRPLHTIFVNASPHHFWFIPECHSQYMHVFPDLTCTDTALDFRNIRTSHPSSWAWSSQTHAIKKLLSGTP